MGMGGMGGMGGMAPPMHLLHLLDGGVPQMDAGPMGPMGPMGGGPMGGGPMGGGPMAMAMGPPPPQQQQQQQQMMMAMMMQQQQGQVQQMQMPPQAGRQAQRQQQLQRPRVQSLQVCAPEGDGGFGAAGGEIYVDGLNLVHDGRQPGRSPHRGSPHRNGGGAPPRASAAMGPPRARTSHASPRGHHALQFARERGGDLKPPLSADSAALAAPPRRAPSHSRLSKARAALVVWWRPNTATRPRPPGTQRLQVRAAPPQPARAPQRLRPQ